MQAAYHDRHHCCQRCRRWGRLHYRDLILLVVTFLKVAAEGIPLLPDAGVVCAGREEFVVSGGGPFVVPGGESVVSGGGGTLVVPRGDRPVVSGGDRSVVSDALSDGGAGGGEG